MTMQENLGTTMVHLRASPFEELRDSRMWFHFERTNILQVEKGERTLHKHAYVLDDAVQTQITPKFVH